MNNTCDIYRVISYQYIPGPTSDTLKNFVEEYFYSPSEAVTCVIKIKSEMLKQYNSFEEYGKMMISPVCLLQLPHLFNLGQKYEIKTVRDSYQTYYNDFIKYITETGKYKDEHILGELTLYKVTIPTSINSDNQVYRVNIVEYDDDEPQKIFSDQTFEYFQKLENAVDFIIDRKSKRIDVWYEFFTNFPSIDKTVIYPHDCALLSYKYDSDQFIDMASQELKTLNKESKDEFIRYIHTNGKYKCDGLFCIYELSIITIN